MRDIKFRGLAKNGSGWLYGMPTHDLKHIFNSESNSSPDNYEVIPETVGQFIESEDSCFYEIFEGDILSFMGANGVVFYEKLSCMFMVHFKKNHSIYSFDSMYAYEGDKYKVIGNIHQNKELLL